MTQLKFDYDNANDLEALLHVVGGMLDESKAGIDQLTDLMDVRFVKNEQLKLIVALLGFPVDNNLEDYSLIRKQLQTAIDYYKNKGTFDSFKVLFYTLGYDVEVIPQWTADITEEREAQTPFLIVTTPPTSVAGAVDVEVINPDLQSAFGTFTYTA